MPSDSGSRRAASGGALERRKTATASKRTTAATTRSVLRVRLCMNKGSLRETSLYRISDRAAFPASIKFVMRLGIRSKPSHGPCQKPKSGRSLPKNSRGGSGLKSATSEFYKDPYLLEKMAEFLPLLQKSAGSSEAFVTRVG